MKEDVHSNVSSNTRVAGYRAAVHFYYTINGIDRTLSCVQVQPWVG